MKSVAEQFGIEVQKWRKSKGWQVGELAEKLGYKTHSVVSEIESGLVSKKGYSDSVKLLLKICKVFNRHPLELLALYSEELSRCYQAHSRLEDVCFLTVRGEIHHGTLNPHVSKPDVPLPNYYSDCWVYVVEDNSLLDHSIRCGDQIVVCENKPHGNSLCLLLLADIKQWVLRKSVIIEDKEYFEDPDKVVRELKQNERKLGYLRCVISRR